MEKKPTQNFGIHDAFGIHESTQLTDSKPQYEQKYRHKHTHL